MNKFHIVKNTKDCNCLLISKDEYIRANHSATHLYSLSERIPYLNASMRLRS